MTFPREGKFTSSPFFASKDGLGSFLCNSVRKGHGSLERMARNLVASLAGCYGPSALKQQKSISILLNSIVPEGPEIEKIHSRSNKKHSPTHERTILA